MIIKRKFISYFSVFLCTLLVGCGNNDNNSYENTQNYTPVTQASTSANIPQNSESPQTINEEHVNQILNWLDMSCTTASNVSASFLSKAVGNALSENSNINYNGIYENSFPTGLESYINDYYDCTIFKEYCIKIDNGTVSTWVSIEMNTDNITAQDTGELWSDLGYTDQNALTAALDRIDKIHYGMYPNRTYSIYQEPDSLPDAPWYSNKKPEL